MRTSVSLFMGVSERERKREEESILMHTPKARRSRSLLHRQRFIYTWLMWRSSLFVYVHIYKFWWPGYTAKVYIYVSVCAHKFLLCGWVLVLYKFLNKCLALR